jgi:hypothetical protein
MYRFLFRFTVTTLTILTANLLTSVISDYMVSYKYSTKPLSFTLIGMAITVVVFYPLFMKLEEWVEDISVKMLKSGRSLTGKYIGLISVFLGGLLILTYFYAKMWYHIDLLRLLLSGNLGGVI